MARCKNDLPSITTEYLRKQPKRPSHHLVDDYISILKPTHRRTTRKLYRVYSQQFQEWLDRNDVVLGNLCRKDVVQWLKHLYDRGLKPGTRALAIVIIHGYLRSLYESGDVRAEPNELLRPSDRPKLPSYLPRPLPPHIDAELTKRFGASANLLPQGLLFMRRTGLRIGELMSLAYDCVREDHKGNHFLKVPLGKLNNERLVPLDVATIKLAERLQQRGPTRRWLMETTDGERPTYRQYCAALEKLTKGLEVNDKITTHRLRHTYATTLLSGGMSLVSIMHLLGHRDLKMTLRYAKVTQETVVREYFEALTQLEKKYRTDPGVRQLTVPDPVEALNDVLRWVRKNAAANPSQNRSAKLLIKRLSRARTEIAALKTVVDE